jgi:uptake hydrogenase large subunit
LADAGKLSLDVLWDGGLVSGTDIRSTRPMAAQLLKGKTPEQVLHVVPLLFSVCGRAQGAAANAALRAARRSAWPEFARVEHSIVCEAIQEHLWRLMLDWPKLLGLPRQEQRFASWYGMLRKISAGEMEMVGFLREFERECLGIPLADWRGLDDYGSLQSWWRKANCTLAKLLAKLAELVHVKPVNVLSLLPAWTAQDAQQACAGRWNADFSARPDWQGDAPETGAWAYYADKPLLHDVLQQSGSKALTRLLARIVDVVEMVTGHAALRLDAASPAEGEGIAVARTARGLLMHHVRLAEENVAAYEIVAPTEWNFHPAGAFALDLSGLIEKDMERVKQLAHIEALSLDPCVAYEIGIHHA